MYYGFDIGGTKIEVGVFDADWRPVWQKRVATPRDDYGQLLTTLKQLTEEADTVDGSLGSIGIGVPGLYERKAGALFTANLPSAMGRPLHQDLTRLLQREIRISNDANCFALSEAHHPDFRLCPVIFGLILGTGVGGGLIVNGRPVNGANGITGEFGHTRLPVDAWDILGAELCQAPCGCGRKGCVENYISGRGFEWLYQHDYAQPLPATAIIQRYYAGDKQAQSHVERYIRLLAACLGSLLTLLDPSVLVLGGGLSNFDAIYSLLPRYLPDFLLPTACLPSLEKARYGDAGGVRGAALLNLLEF
ncbi:MULTISPECIES: N-acetylglucosamine kinase [Lonsdalea]|uniref:N-acetylglucosamine kinase n=2 Tax=Lonsdalea TaxID=1082702 RepID=A0ACD1J8P2_9GAMM|nr:MULTISPECIES: N-acetylglucosamine kinase [Lonsdalea]OSN02775.1 N-acetylglucosamine kinase [Lonsdalea populi]QPQ25461.1 N-acetylglucosamine kinase [Lonsdalea populi]RAT10918.1 N-acetylglucosamine kinase [Lonsdalea quercina]RAT15252.1 N-acetylglucosamine kinase [Lonsdalea quercina]RAT18860.1 N-acetylglucosamine kinase [Lonsdalea populi]